MLRAEWAATLGAAPTDHDDFEESGGDPLLLARILARVGRITGTRIRPGDLARPVNIGVLVDAVAGPDPADVVLAPEVQPLGPTGGVTPGDVLLTGATGFLGVHLLTALLARTPATMHCLARGSDEQDAMERLVAVARSYDLEVDWGRVVVHPGDVGAPGLGVPPESLALLESEVTTIVHSAAEVNFLLPAEELWAVNVGGVDTVLRLACTGRPKSVHHLSTLGVLTEHAVPEVREESAPAPSSSASGYVVTKCAAERLVEAAHSRGVEAWIHRPWVLMGHARTGAADPADYTTRVLLGCVQLGAAPDLDVACNVVPVDHVSRAIAELVVSGPRRPERPWLHYSNPRPAALAEVWRWVSECGHRLDLLPLGEWLARLAEAPEDNALRPLLPMLAPANGAVSTLPRISTSRSDRLLACSGLRCAPVDRDLVAGVLGHLERSRGAAGPGSSRGRAGPMSLADLLPRGAVSDERVCDLEPGRLPPEEAAAVAGAVPSRQQEFATTRACARSALARLGFADTVLPRGPGGAPRWPAGVTGSLTHCAGYRAAAAAPLGVITSLGIDAEPDEPLPPGVVGIVASVSEREHLDALPGDGPCWDRLLFSAKESVYKAWYPVMGCWLGFEDVEVRLRDESFSVSLHRRLGRGVRAVDRLEGRWTRWQGLLLTVVAHEAVGG